MRQYYVVQTEYKYVYENHVNLNVTTKETDTTTSCTHRVFIPPNVYTPNPIVFPAKCFVDIYVSVDHEVNSGEEINDLFMYRQYTVHGYKILETT